MIYNMNEKAIEFNALHEPDGLGLCGAIQGETAIAVTGRPVAGSIPTSSTL
jgi:hypothetical protein